jgi:hypothetical protein
MAERATYMETLNRILSQQGKLGKPPADICNNIASLKDLCELHETHIEWRRGATDNERPMFRNGSNSSLSPTSPKQGFHRTNSTKSFTTHVSDSSPGNNSPTVKPTPTYVPNRYQSKFTNAVDSTVNDRILNNILLSKMNKFSHTTYSDVREFLYQILGSEDPDVAEMIRHFMRMVFKKAASEEIYCSLYAKLLSEISSRYKVILEEMHALQENYLDIFDDVEETAVGEHYNTFVEKNVEKRYRRGYSQFIAELTMLNIIGLPHLEKTFTKIFDYIMKGATQENKKTIIEEYTDCLLRMSKVFKNKNSTFINTSRSSLNALSIPHIDYILKNKDILPSISQKTKFVLMDVKDNLSA